MDAREPERQPARVAGARLDGVEGDFQDDLRADFAIASMAGNGSGGEMFGEFLDLYVGETGVGFADGQELPGGIITHGKGPRRARTAATARARGRGDTDQVTVTIFAAWILPLLTW